MDTPNEPNTNPASNTTSAPKTDQLTHIDGDKNMFLGILSYLGPLVIVSFLVEKNSSFVKFHIKQGAVLFFIEIVLWVLGYIFWPLWFIGRIIHFAVIILSIVGIVYVVQGKEKELPLVGRFSKYFTFI